MGFLLSFNSPVCDRSDEKFKPRLMHVKRMVSKVELGQSLHRLLWFYTRVDGFGVLVVSMLTSGTRVRGFKPGRSRWNFLGI